MDTTAVVDSVVIVTPLIELLGNTFPWLDEQVINWVANALGAVPIVALIVGWEFVGKWLNKISPLIRDTFGAALSKHSWIINPFLGGLIGGGMGDSSLGLVAGAVWGIIRKSPLGGATTFGLAKARNVAILLLLSMFVITSNSYAADTSSAEAKKTYEYLGITNTSSGTVSYLSKTRFTYSVGMGQKFVRFSDMGYVNDNHSFMAGQVGYQVSNAIGIRTRVDKNISKQLGNPWNYEVSGWIIF